MQSNIITVIPVYNGEKFIGETLESVARQILKPDRVVVLDNCSTDNTEKVVKEFTGVKIEWIRNPKNLGLFGNCNRALEFSPEAKYLHLMCADDLVEPDFYKVLTGELDSTDGLALAYSLDERIDEQDRRLSISGKIIDCSTVIPVDVFLMRKA